MKIGNNLVFEALSKGLSFLRRSPDIVNPNDWHLVTNVDDFEIHVNAHITRVKIIGTNVATRFFPHIDLTLINEYLGMHDAEKLIDTPEFRKIMGIDSQARSLLENLFEHFGKLREVRTAAEMAAFEQIRFQLNEIGSRISREWLVKNNLWIDGEPRPTEEGQTFLLIEHVADVLDRELDPIAYHELGKTVFDVTYNPNSADHYVESLLEKRILKLMRPHYSHLVEGNTYLDWVKREFVQSKAKDRTACLLVLRRLFATL